MLSSLPSYTVSWKHKSGAYTVLVSTGCCKKGCLSLVNEHEQQGNKRSVLTQRLYYMQTISTKLPNIHYIGLCICFCTTWQSQEEEVSLIYYSLAPSGRLQSESLYRCLCSIYYCAFRVERGTKSPEVLKDRRLFRNQGGKKLKSVSLSIRADTGPLATHLWIKLKKKKKKEQDLLAGCFFELSLSSLLIPAFLFSFLLPGC